MKNRLFPSSLWQPSIYLKIINLYFFTLPVKLNILLLWEFLPLWILLQSTPPWRAVPQPRSSMLAVFLPVLSRTEGSIHVSKPLLLFLYLSVTLAIFTTMWRCWLMLSLSLTVTPASFLAELLPNLFLPILYLYSLLGVEYCCCTCWTLFFFLILLVCKHNFVFYSSVDPLALFRSHSY